jgi:AbrB family looped-hinge helix DNA binding protein
MATTKVTRHYQVTIPADVRVEAAVQQGDVLLVQYDKAEGAIKLRPRKRGARRTATLGRKVGLAEIELAITRGMKECLA